VKNWALVFALGATLACGGAASGQTLADTPPRHAPEFVREDLTGQQIDLNQYRGKVVLLNFWATWCGPCRVELPKFKEWQKEYGGNGLQILAVSMDDADAPVRRAVRRMHLNFPVLMGDAQIGELYGGVLGLPVTFLIDRKGKIVTKIKGGADLAALESQVRVLVAGR
jgi:cytochrome c biogenesis protein CcmG, thiol:disulfide interchange protein DsbE